MKTIQLLGVLLLTGILSVSAQKSDINTVKSSVKWTGNKISGSHNGDIKVKSGQITLKNGEIAGGEVVIDMNSITCADLTDEGYNKKLVGHLKSDDFFGVDKFPASTFKVSKATKFKDGISTVTGVLTIKGKSETINTEISRKGTTYSTQLKVDRSKFNVRYGSNSFFDNLGNKAIDDIFILDIQLVL